MTGVRFFAKKEVLVGFDISGHCSVDNDDEMGKVVCAAVSSAAYLTVNTITDIIGDSCEIKCDDAIMSLRVKNPSKETVVVLEGLKLHLKSLSKQYSNNIKYYGGVDNVKD